MAVDSIQREDSMDQCGGGGCSACEPVNDTLQFASMKEIEEFYDIHGEDLYVDPAEQDLEAMIQEMIDSEIDFDSEFNV
jgi:hypothetical protein